MRPRSKRSPRPCRHKRKGHAHTRSFVVTLPLVRDEWLLSSLASPGAIPRHLDKLRENLRRLVLPAPSVLPQLAKSCEVQDEQLAQAAPLARRGARQVTGIGTCAEQARVGMRPMA